MRALNRRFRGLDETTDVLAFPPAPESAIIRPTPEGEKGTQERGKGDPLPAGPPAHLGDVAISVDEAVRQAADLAESLGACIDRLLVHGILHLKGYDHHSAREAARMRRQEKRLLSLLEKMDAGARARPEGSARAGRLRARPREG